MILDLELRNALIIYTNDEQVYYDFGLCDNEEFSIKQEDGIDGLEECIFDKFNEDDEEEIEDFETKKREIIPEEYIELLDFIKEKLKTYSEIQIKFKED